MSEMSRDQSGEMTERIEHEETDKVGERSSQIKQGEDNEHSDGYKEDSMQHNMKRLKNELDQITGPTDHQERYNQLADNTEENENYNNGERNESLITRVKEERHISEHSGRKETEQRSEREGQETNINENMAGYQVNENEPNEDDMQNQMKQLAQDSNPYSYKIGSHSKVKTKSNRSPNRDPNQIGGLDKKTKKYLKNPPSTVHMYKTEDQASPDRSRGLGQSQPVNTSYEGESQSRAQPFNPEMADSGLFERPKQSQPDSQLSESMMMKKKQFYRIAKGHDYFDIEKDKRIYGIGHSGEDKLSDPHFKMSYSKIKADSSKKMEEVVKKNVELERRDALASAKFIEKINQDRKRREQSMQQRQQRLQNHLAKQLEGIQMRKNAEIEAKYNMVERSIKAREYEMKGQVRKEANEISNQIVRDIIKNKPMDYFEYKYQIEVVEPERKRKEAILNERHKMYRSVGNQEIEEHNKMHEERLKILHDVKRAYKQMEEKQHRFVPHKSMFYERVQKRDQRKRMKEYKKEEKKRELILRRKKYGDYVKQFINNPQEQSDYDVDVPEDNDYDRDYSATYKDYDVNQRKQSNDKYFQDVQRMPRNNESEMAMTVSKRKQIYSHLGPGSMIPQAREPTSRTEQHTKADERYRNLENPQLDHLNKGYSRNIRSEYKSQFVNYVDPADTQSPRNRPKPPPLAAKAKYNNRSSSNKRFKY